jgi:hypothetical protein
MAAGVEVIHGGDAQNPWDITHVVSLFIMAILYVYITWLQVLR